jgi:hypothetical protein
MNLAAKLWLNFFKDKIKGGFLKRGKKGNGVME